MINIANAHELLNERTLLRLSKGKATEKGERQTERERDESE